MTTIGASFPIPRPDLEDVANIESAFNEVYLGDGITDGLESHLAGLSTRIESISVALGGSPQSNVSFNQSQFSLNDGGGKVAAFRINASSATPSTYTLPLATSTDPVELATTGTSQVLSLKTLAAPNVTSGINITSGAVLLGSIVQENAKLSHTKSSSGLVYGSIDTIGTSDARGGEYVVVALSDTGSKYAVSKVLFVHNGSEVFITEYGCVSTSSDYTVTVTAELVATTITFTAQVSSASKINMFRTLLK